MLEKNIWIIYPAGYGGTFINWAINKSDLDQSTVTIDDPVNKSNSDSLGSKGTSHLHIKIPTHQSINDHMCWLLLNKPSKKQVYSVNGLWDKTISLVREFDPTGVFIVIHNDNDILQNSFGRINCITKWPTYFYGWLCRNYKNGIAHIHDTFDPYNCANDKILRNYLVYNPYVIKNQYPIDYENLKEIVNSKLRWYYARNEKQPHEVNEQYYITDNSYLNRIFEVGTSTLFSNNFIDWFENFMEKSNISNGFNTDKVKTIFPEFLSSQENLKWFTSIKYWKNTGKVNSYLTSHSVIEAEFIRYIHHLIPESYQSDWDVLTLQQFSDLYFEQIKFK